MKGQRLQWCLYLGSVSRFSLFDSTTVCFSLSRCACLRMAASLSHVPRVCSSSRLSAVSVQQCTQCMGQRSQVTYITSTDERREVQNKHYIPSLRVDAFCSCSNAAVYALSHVLSLSVKISHCCRRLPSTVPANWSSWCSLRMVRS